MDNLDLFRREHLLTENFYQLSGQIRWLLLLPKLLGMRVTLLDILGRGFESAVPLLTCGHAVPSVRQYIDNKNLSTIIVVLVKLNIASTDVQYLAQWTVKWLPYSLCLLEHLTIPNNYIIKWVSRMCEL